MIRRGKIQSIWILSVLLMLITLFVGLIDSARAWFVLESPNKIQTEVMINNMQLSVYQDSVTPQNKINPTYSSNGLPSEYQEVEYLESTGTQVIDTGILPSENHKIRIKADWTKVPTFSGEGNNFNRSVFGVQGSNGLRVTYGMVWNSTEDTLYDEVYLSPYNADKYLTGNNPIYYPTTFGLIDYTIDIKNLLHTNNITNQTKSLRRDASKGLPEYSYALFAHKNSNNSYSAGVSDERYHGAHAKVYELQIWDEDLLVLDYIPCYRKSDGVLGMYDTVSGNFLTNQGTGNFSKGEDVVRNENTTTGVPSAYQAVEYIQSNGGQYIDTGYIMKATDKVSIDFETTTALSGNIALFGGRKTTNSHSYTIFAHVGGESVRFDLSGKNNSQVIAQLGDIGKHNITKDGIYNYIDGVEQTSNVNPTNYNNNVSAYLLAVNTNGTAGMPISCKLYNCKIWSDNNLVLNLLPCVRKSDNVVGMYDTVSGDFLVNKGTGTFTAGPNVSTSQDSQAYIRLDGEVEPDVTKNLNLILKNDDNGSSSMYVRFKFEVYALSVDGALTGVTIDEGGDFTKSGDWYYYIDGSGYSNILGQSVQTTMLTGFKIPYSAMKNLKHSESLKIVLTVEASTEAYSL